ncbi:MAG TPA: nucleoside-diphosphate kinase [Candidatus Norongarragalinales archaeon]|nr:nucleoside-diphosphate kinase [Candidatus Norongarragalinales archaeon]
MVEKTFVMFKPDCMKKKILGKVMQRLDDAGLSLVALKMVRMDDEMLDTHYAHHKDKPFFEGFKSFMKSAPVVMSVWEGENAVAKVRELCGPTDSAKAAKGSVRGDFGKDIQENIIHASDSVETAEKEVKRFFRETELVEWQ